MGLHCGLVQTGPEAAPRIVKQNITIYHNPRCSKSRQTLALLQDRGLEPRIIRYLDNPPDRETLTALLEMLEMQPRNLMRTGESIYRQNNLDDPALTDDALVDAMLEHPVLIQRPIVVHGNDARIGRPPEQVLDIL